MGAMKLYRFENAIATCTSLHWDMTSTSHRRKKRQQKIAKRACKLN
jgi:hypothetical protein